MALSCLDFFQETRPSRIFSWRDMDFVSFTQEILRHDSWHCWKLLWKFNELFARFKLKSNNFPWAHYFEFLKPLILSNILVLITVAKICWKPLTPTDQYIEQTNKCTKCSDAVFPLPDNKCHMQCSSSWNDCPRSLPLEMHSTPSLSTSLLNPTLSFFAQIGPTFYFITSIRYAFWGLMYLFSFNISFLIPKEGTKDLKDS